MRFEARPYSLSEAGPYSPSEAERLDIGFNYLHISDDSIGIDEDIFDAPEPNIIPSLSSIAVPEDQEACSEAEKEELRKRGFSRRKLIDIVDSISSDSVLSYALPLQTSRSDSQRKYH